MYGGLPLTAMRSNWIRSRWAPAAPSTTATAQPLPGPGWHQTLRDPPPAGTLLAIDETHINRVGHPPSPVPATRADVTRHLNACSELLGELRHPLQPRPTAYPAACSQEHQRLLA